MSTIVVIGSTGAQGGGVARAASKSFTTIKLASRKPASSESMKSLLESLPGTTAVQVDLDDKESIVASFLGADAAFATFNYWGTLASVGYDETKAVEAEVQQGKNVVDAAKQAGVKHLVLSTLEDVETITKGKLHCWHFTAQGRIETYAKQQGVAFTFVRYAFYFQNFGTFFTPDEQGRFQIPMKDHVLDAVDTEDAGNAIAKIFEEGPTVWAGKEIGLASDSRPVQEYLDILNEVKQDGIDRKYVAVDWAEMARNPAAKDLAEMFNFYTDYDQDCIRDISATKKLYPGLRDFRAYAVAAMEAGKA
jgi:uncharacterized protein YbjT (DUF2867 family)